MHFKRVWKRIHQIARALWKIALRYIFKWIIVIAYCIGLKGLLRGIKWLIVIIFIGRKVGALSAFRENSLSYIVYSQDKNIYFRRIWVGLGPFSIPHYSFFSLSLLEKFWHDRNFCWLGPIKKHLSRFLFHTKTIKRYMHVWKLLIKHNESYM